jgi:hypothetical protein
VLHSKFRVLCEIEGRAVACEPAICPDVERLHSSHTATPFLTMSCGVMNKERDERNYPEQNDRENNCHFAA